MHRDSVRPDEGLFPGIGDSGRGMLRQLLEHPAAPRYRNRSGHRLEADDLPWLRHFTREVMAASIGWPAQGRPAWLADFLTDVYRRVPAYRQRGAPPDDWHSLPTLSRADLSRDITRFVPNELPLNRLIEYSTSGTTGHPLKLPSHPRVSASYLAFHRRALARFGIALRAGRGEVSVVLAGFQARCFTYVSFNPLLDDAGLAKINLHPNDWQTPEDRVTYLDAMAPELITGDPISLSALAELPLQHRPRALLSTSMAMSAGLRAALSARFACPVLDLYSMNECGPIAVYAPELDGHLLLQPRLFVEILDPTGHPVPEGERGEITLTGGFNPYLPLLRYRTGDFAALRMTAEGPLLCGLLGRPPVRFQTAGGQWINNVDVSHCLARFALPQYTLHQCADRSLRLGLPAAQATQQAPICAALHGLFGATVPIALSALPLADKVIQYTSDLA